MRFLHRYVLLTLQLSIKLYSAATTHQTDVIVLGGTGNLASKHLWFGLSRLIINNTTTLNLFAAGRSNLVLGRTKLSTVLHKLGLEGILNVTYVQLQTDDDYKNFCSKVLPMARVFYLAIPPIDQVLVYNKITSHCKSKPDIGWIRIAIEKPFTDELLQRVSNNNNNNNSHVYLVDHYLWKKTVRYLHDFRILNHQQLSKTWILSNISKIEINCLETETAENRTIFYDSVHGVIGDIMESHLTQLLFHLLTDPQTNQSSIKNTKTHLATTISPITPQDVYFAQYSSYTGQPTTPTYAIARIFSSHSSLNSTSIYFQSGKALPSKSSGITLTFTNNATINISIYPDVAIFVDRRLFTNNNPLRCGLNWKLTDKGCVAEDSEDDSYSQVFLSIIRGSAINFVSPQVALLASKPWRKLKEFLAKSSVAVDKYEDYKEIKLYYDVQLGWIKENKRGRREEL